MNCDRLIPDPRYPIGSRVAVSWEPPGPVVLSGTVEKAAWDELCEAWRYLVEIKNLGRYDVTEGVIDLCRELLGERSWRGMTGQTEGEES